MTALSFDHGGRAAPLFDAHCVVVEASPRLVDDALFAQERAFIAKAVDKRRAEFGSARLCAREALAQLGAAPVPLVPGADRAPVWPAGVAGSITHTQGYCGVVVASTEHHASLGLDAEQDRPLAPELIAMICTPAERAQSVARDAILYFAAKEAFYKCQYPLTRQFLDFQDVELALDAQRGEFRARVLRPLPQRPAWLDALHGKILRRDGLVLCGVSLPAALC
jgi:4'-phosphopantetheinyl transferase EntD